MPLIVVNNATLKCQHGSARCKLVATTASAVLGEMQAFASLLDHQSGSHVAGFGDCDLDGKPCEPQTPIPWEFTATAIPLVPDPVLTTWSKLRCMKAGGPVIKIIDAGQSTVWVDDFPPIPDNVEDDDARRQALMEFAVSEIDNPNQAEALANVVEWASRLVAAIPHRRPVFGGRLAYHRPLFRAHKMMEDLKQVLVGEGLLSDNGIDNTGIEGGRGEGRFFAAKRDRGGATFTNRGFKPIYRPSAPQARGHDNQVQHAMAALLIGRKDLPLVRPFERCIMDGGCPIIPRESSPEDRALYRDLFPVGRDLDEGNYRELGGRVRRITSDR